MVATRCRAPSLKNEAEGLALAGRQVEQAGRLAVAQAATAAESLRGEMVVQGMAKGQGCAACSIPFV